MRLAVAASHPIQYYAPLFAELARRIELKVFFAHKASPQEQAAAGFGTAFEWDVDLTAGYDHEFLRNVARTPDVNHFDGCDTPDIGDRLEQGGFDAVLVMGWRLKSSIQAIRATKRARIPVIMRGDSQLNTPRSLIKRMAKAVTYPFFLRQFDAALYVGQASRAYYEHYRYPNERLFFSPHCVDTAWFAERATAEARTQLRERLGLSGDAKLVLFAGKLVDYKRPLDAIDAIAQASSRSSAVQLLVAGSGELEGAMRERAKERGVTVHWFGFQNQTEMPAVYAACDLLILPSDARETWGLVCNEALACGKPILVSSAAGCAADLVEPGAGRMFALGDVTRAAADIEALLGGEADGGAIGSKSAAYSIAAAADGVIEALSGVTRVLRPGSSRLDSSE